MIVKNQKASQILNNFTPLPQVNYNFYHKNNPDIINNVKVQTVLSEIKKELGSNGRAIIRKSGTEPLIRIMFEGKNLDLLNKLQDKFIAVLEKNI